MGKKGKGGVGYGANKKLPPTSALVHAQPLTLRQQAGRPGGAGLVSKPLNPSAHVASLRADHLLRLATWASANAPPLGALLGARLACLGEAAGVPPPDTPHSICERSLPCILFPLRITDMFSPDFLATKLVKP